MKRASGNQQRNPQEVADVPTHSRFLTMSSKTMVLLLQYLLAASLLIRFAATSDLVYSDATSQCHGTTTQGKTTCCCDGDCGSGPVPSGEWTWGVGCID